MPTLTVSPPRGGGEQHYVPNHSASAASTHAIMQPPAWVPDVAVSECTLCLATFGLFRRKHHCRACGKIFCGNCSRHQSTIPEFGYFKPTRVCNLCVQRASSLDTPPHSKKRPAFPRSPALTRGQQRYRPSSLQPSHDEYAPAMHSAVSDRVHSNLGGKGTHKEIVHILKEKCRN